MKLDWFESELVYYLDVFEERQEYVAHVVCRGEESFVGEDSKDGGGHHAGHRVATERRVITVHRPGNFPSADHSPDRVSVSDGTANLQSKIRNDSIFLTALSHRPL